MFALKESLAGFAGRASAFASACPELVGRATVSGFAGTAAVFGAGTSSFRHPDWDATNASATARKGETAEQRIMDSGKREKREPAHPPKTTPVFAEEGARTAARENPPHIQNGRNRFGKARPSEPPNNTPARLPPEAAQAVVALLPYLAGSNLETPRPARLNRTPPAS